MKFSDYATKTKAGLVFPRSRGFGIGSRGDLYLFGASQQVIAGKSSGDIPITPSMLDYAVKVGITTNTETLTDEEKVAVANWLASADTKNGQIVSRSSLGYIYVPLVPNALAAATSKYYVDDGFVPKSTGSADRIMLYGIDTEGNQIIVGTSPSAANNGMVPLYNRAGNINAAAPQNGNQVANKYYVDENKGTKLYLHKFPIVYDISNAGQNRYLSFISTSSKKQIIDYNGDGSTYTLDFYFDGWNIHMWSSDGTTKLSSVYWLMNLSYTNYNLYTTPVTGGVSIDIPFESLTDEKYTVTAL